MITRFIETNSAGIFLQQSGDSKSPAIIFIHGASISSEIWNHQFADENLLKNFCLYAFDLPGHGQSEKAKHPEKDYTLKGLGKTVAEIISTLSLEEYLIVTLSISSNIVAETLQTLTGCKGVFMAGACLIGDKFPIASFVQPFPYMYLLSASKATVVELEDYAQYDMYHPSKDNVEKFIADYQNTDPLFRNTIGKVLAEADYSDEVEIVKKSGIPFALIYGKEEAIVKPLYLQSAGLQLWGDKIHLIENAGHLVNTDNPGDFNRLVAGFATDCFKR